MRKFLVLGLVLAVLASLAVGQTAGVHRGLYIGVGNYRLTSLGPLLSAVGEYTPQNVFMMYPTGHSAWPHWGNMWHATQDVDNQSVITYALVGSAPNSLAFVQWDPILPGVLNTLWITPYTGTTYPANVTNITLNSDGDIVGYSTQYNQVVRFDRLNNQWVGTTLTTATGVNGGLGGFDWDKINGGYLLANCRSSTTPLQNLIRIAPNLSSSTIVATTANANVLVNMGGGPLENGDWVGSSYTSFLYTEVKAGTGQWSTGPTSTFGTLTDVTPERFSAAGRGYYGSLVSVAGSLQNHAIGYFDATTTPHTVTTLAMPAPLPNNVLGWCMEAMPLYDRDLCTMRTGKATWDIRIKPDPAGIFGGKPYIVAVSLAGGKPAIVLPDKREIFILPDMLTVGTVRGGFPPLLTGNVGMLDVFGTATAKLDLTLLGTAANGSIAHFCGVVLDPASPSGIGWVLEPWAFLINVLP